MKVDLRQAFKDFMGNVVKSGDKVVMMCDEIGKVLYMYGVNKNVSADEKYMAYRLCHKIQHEGSVELTLDEASFIVKVCGEAFSAGAYGQVKDLLEG